MQTNNENLNYLITLADDAHTYGHTGEFDRILSAISRHYYPLSFLPQGGGGWEGEENENGGEYRLPL
jgi:hypothetical protein